MEAGGGRRSGVVKGGSGKRPSPASAGRDAKRPFYIVLALVLIAGITALSYMATRPRQNVAQVDTTLPPIPNQGHVIGSDTARIEVVEFADFECPACGSFATLTEPDVRKRLVNTGIIRYRFMDFPLSMHRNTWPAHRAAWCAGDQGRFWEMHDALFFNQDRWNGEATSRPEGVIGELARGVGVDMQRFDSCVESRKYDPQIRANQQEAERRQVNSTPTFIIGTKKVSSAISYDEFKKHVDEALAEARPAQPQTGTKAAPPR